MDLDLASRAFLHPVSLPAFASGIEIADAEAIPPSKVQKTAAPTAMQVENVAGESDFASLTCWLMANTKDKELTVLMAQ